MSIPAELIERARSTDLRDLAVLQYGVVLKRVGVNEFEGPCPACREGRDRFSINTRKRVWHCRHCSQKGDGDAISLIQRIENCTFAEAVSKLTGASWTPSEPRRSNPCRQAR